MFRPFLAITLAILSLVSLPKVAAGQSPDVLKAEQAKDARPPLKKCWEYLFQNGAGQFVSGFQDKIFISESDGRLRAISSVSNETIWLSELGGKFAAVVPSDRNGLFVLSSSKDETGAPLGTLRLVDFNSGLAKYSVPVTFMEPVTMKIAGSRMIVASSTGELEAFDAMSGTSVWKAKSSGKIASDPAVFDNLVAVSNDQKKIEFFSVLDGSLLTSVTTEREMKELIFRANQMLVAGDDRGNATNFRDQSGAVWWRFKSGARIGTMVETDEGILVGSFDNFVYMISKYSGGVKWKRRLDGRIIHRPIVTGKELIFTVSGEDDLVVLDSESGKVLEQTSFGEGRLPIADPILLDRGILVFPLAGGMIGFSTNGCK